MTMPVSEQRQIRLFLSSTFRDMEKERHELLTRVFPLFRQRCLERQVVFSEIDLRWGITEEDARNGQTVQICLQEIERCRALGIQPFFIGFIAERYGWVPQPHELERYWQSTDNADNPYARRIETALKARISVTELEMRFGFMDNDDHAAARRVQLYFRDPELTQQLAFAEPDQQQNFYETEPECRQKLDALKAAIRERHANCIGIDGYRETGQFAEHVLQFLTAQLDARFPRENVPDERQLRQHAQRCYALSRRESYVPLLSFRHEVQSWYADALKAATLPVAATPALPANRLALVGASGRGKSAFMADIMAADVFPDALVVAHFVGADGDTTLEGWRERVLLALAPWLPAESQMPQSGEVRWMAFAQWVAYAQAAMGKPLVLLIDAVNQLSAHESALRRLDALHFTPHTLLLVTSTDSPSADWPTRAFPELDSDTRREAIALFLQQYSKKLPASLVEPLIAAPACANALFLRLVLEELRLHADHDSLSKRIATLLRFDDAGEMFLALLNETDRDFSAEGDSLASYATTLIAASRAGLSLQDLATLLTPHLRKAAPRMADLHLLQLIARIQPFCLNDNGRLRITHSVFTRTLSALSPLMAPSRRALVKWFSGQDAFSVAERIFQWLALDEEEPLVRTLGRIDSVTVLQQNYADLATQAMLRLGAGRSTLSLPLQALAELWENEQPPEAVSSRVNQVSAWFLQQGFWLIGVHWCTTMVPLIRQRYRDDVVQYMAAVNNLGLFYRQLSLYDEAETLMSDALAFMRKMLPAGHIDIAIMLNNLAGVYGSLGRDADAEPLLLEAQQSLSNEDDLHFANITQSLGECYQNLEKYAKAEALLLQALAVRERLQPADHPHLIGIKRSLGTLFMQQERYREAEPLLLEALSRRRAILPAMHPDIAVSLNELGELYLRQRQYAQAEPLFTEMLTIKREALPYGHPGIALSLMYLAVLYQMQNRLDEAEGLLLEALDILGHSYGPGHEDLLAAQNTLADIYLSQGKYEQLIALHETLNPPPGDASSPDQPEPDDWLNNLALRLLGEGHLTGALLGWQRWLDRQQNRLAEDDLRRLEVVRNIACLHKAEQRYEEARELMLQLVAIRFEKHPSDAWGNAQSLFDLAAVYDDLQAYSQAEIKYRQLFTMLDPMMPDEHPEKIKVLNRLVELGRINAQSGAQVPREIHQPAAPAATTAKHSLGDRVRNVWRNLTR